MKNVQYWTRKCNDHVWIVFIQEVCMALTFDPFNYISAFSKKKDFIIWGSLRPMPKSRAISLRTWTWGQLMMIIFLSFREVRQSIHQIDKQKIYGQNMIGYTVWIWLFWLQEFRCCTWSPLRFLPSCTRWRTRERRFTVTLWRISPKSLWSFWLNICGSRML